MNILYELGLQGRGTLMLVPTNMPTAGAGSVIPPYGLLGVKDLQEAGGSQAASGNGIRILASSTQKRT